MQQQSESEEAGLQHDQDSYNQDAAQYQAELDRANAELEAIAQANANKYGGSSSNSQSSEESAGSSSNAGDSSSQGGCTSSSGGGESQTGGSAGDSASSSGYLWPCASHTISSYYGYRGGSMHRGLDISAPGGTPIYAAKSGVVIVSMMGYSGSGFGGYGNVVMIQHDDGTYTLYAHCQTRYVSEGDRVSQGQTIAAVGNTGDVYGANGGYHLHFEIRRGISSSTTVDPLDYL